MSNTASAAADIRLGDDILDERAKGDMVSRAGDSCSKDDASFDTGGGTLIGKLRVSRFECLAATFGRAGSEARCFCRGLSKHGEETGSEGSCSTVGLIGF